MSEGKPKSRGGHWKRPPTKVYDYNYDVGQHYYKPMLNHLDKKSAGVESELPGPKTFAERLAEDPLYGKAKPVNYVSSDIPEGRSAKDYDELKADGLKKRLDDILGDYGKGGDNDELLGSKRPERSDRYALPSVTDQILDSAGLKLRGDSLEDRLAEVRRRPFKESTPVGDLDALLSKGSNNKGADYSEESFDKAIEESLNRRRNLLRDLNNELAKIDTDIEQYGSASSASRQSKALASARAEQALASEMSASSRYEASSSTKVNIKQRRVKTTITTETVRG